MITELLSVAWSTSQPVSVRLIIDACAIFGFSENSVRVALAKMRSEGFVETPERAHYRLGPEARPVMERVLAWRSVGDRAVRWDGSWVSTFAAHLTRTDRPALRRRTRALRLQGFAAIEPGLYLRPNNLRGGASALREQLVHLGMEDRAIVSRLDDLSDHDESRALLLWDADSIVNAYTELKAELERSTATRHELPLHVALREAFLIGRQVLRAIALDPLLPKELVPTAAREELIQTMSRYNETGTTLWRRYLGVDETREVA